MMSSPPLTPLDLAGLSISSQRNDTYDSHPQGFYSTAPSSAPYVQQPYDNHQQGHFNTTIASMASKSRGGLPTHWLDQQSSGTSSIQDGRSISPPTDSSSPPPNSFLSGSASAGGHSQHGALGVQPSQMGGDDDIIPTAIVIKNIPFSVRRETLLEIIASLSIPTPYAFNYHVDAAGAFRGLAFANFRLAADADAVVAALNGFDVQGRKLRVEYKKVLQAGEKERIEREKAIRRMRSMQMEKERAATAQGNAGDWEDYGQVQSTQQYQGANPVPIGMGIPVNNGGGYGISGGNGNVMQSPGRSYSGGGMNQLPSPTLSGVPPVPAIPQQYYQMPRQTSQHQPPMLHVTTPPPDPYGHHLRSFSPPAASRTSPPPMVHRQESQHQQNLLEPVVSIPSKNYNELDMNDPSTLEIYSRVLLFKDDRMRDEMAFSRSLSAMERRVVHMVAKKLGLYHRSVGEGSERYAVVMRYPPDNARPPPRQPSGTLSRAQSSYLSTSTSGVPPPSPRSPSSNPPSAALRAKKSMPDLSSLHAPSARLNSRSSNGNIREGYATISGAGRRATPNFNGLFGHSNGDNADGGVPPVPTLPPNLDSALASTSGPGAGGSGGVVRQPRGPTGDGFGGRRVSDMASSRTTNSPVAKPVSGAAGGTSIGSDALDTRSHEPFEF